MSEFTTVSCPSCSANLKLKLAGQDLTGKQVKCPGCSEKFGVEDAISVRTAAPVTDRLSSIPDRQLGASPRTKTPDARTPNSLENDYAPDDIDTGTNHKSPPASGQGFLGWLIFGLGAGTCCAVVTALAGYAHSNALISGLAVLTGIAVGAAIRVAGKSECGAASAMVAAVIAVGCMFVGKVGAFMVAPTLSEFGEFAEQMRVMSTEEMEQLIEQQSSESGMIGNLASELERDEEWQKENGITEETIRAHWDQIPEEDVNNENVDYEAQYLPQIWKEASRRWNENTPEQKQTLVAERQKALRADNGMMNDEEVAELIKESTTDEAMIESTAWDLYFDDEWQAENNITESQIDEHEQNMADDAEGADQFPPAIWEAATKRWEETAPAEKKNQIDEMAENLRLENTRTEEDEQIENAAVGIIKVFVAIFAAIVHFFSPFLSLLCSLVGILAALGLASGFPTIN